MKSPVQQTTSGVSSTCDHCSDSIYIYNDIWDGRNKWSAGIFIDLFWVEWDIAWWDFRGKSLDFIYFMEKSWDFHGISWDIMGDSGISSCSILNGSDLGEKIMWSPVSPSTLGNPRSNCRGILQPWSIAKGYLIDFPWFSYVSWCFLMFLDGPFI